MFTLIRIIGDPEGSKSLVHFVFATVKFYFYFILFIYLFISNLANASILWNSDDIPTPSKKKYINDYFNN